MPASPARALAALAVAAVLAGCASLSPQPRGDDISPLLQSRGAHALDWDTLSAPADERATIDQWLTQPMTLDAALRVAMLRSPRLQEEYARLGLARAEVLEAVQVDNPRLSLSRLSVDGGGDKRTAGVSLPLLDLLLLPARTRLASADYERSRREVASSVLNVAADVQVGWYEYVAARQVAAMRAAVAEGAAASAELAQRFFDAGNISELQLRQEQAIASQARIDALRAKADAGRRRLALNSLLGLSGAQAAWEASDNLPLPVPAEDDPERLLALASEGNLELLAARQEARVLADALRLTQRWRWLGGSEIGYEREEEADGKRLRGPHLALELPVFNQGQAKLARAQAQLAGAQARVARAELSTRNGVRQGAEAVAAMREVVATHRESLVPQREDIVARQQERQNYMLIGVFELVQAKMAEYDAYQAYLEAVRDYWLARVELSRAVGQRLPSDADVGPLTPGVQDILKPAGATMDHSMHGGMDHSGHGGMDHSMHGGKPAAAPVDHSRHGARPAGADAAADHSGHGEPSPAEPSKDDGEEDEHAHHHGATP